MLTVGVDVGGTKCYAAAVDGRDAVVAERRHPTPAGPDALIETIAAVAGEVIAAVGDAEVGALGVGVPGLVSRAGVLRFAPNLPGVSELDVRSALATKFPRLAITVDNDATCAGIAEWAV